MVADNYEIGCVADAHLADPTCHAEMLKVEDKNHGEPWGVGESVSPTAE